MKKLLLFTLITIAFFLGGCKQGIEQAPKAIIDTFETMFSDATYVEWSRHASVFKADFYHDGHEKEAQFDSTGAWLLTKTKLSIYEVPTAVMKVAYKSSKGTIDNVYLFEQPNGAVAYYMVEYRLRAAFSTRQLHVLPDGTIFSAL